MNITAFGGGANNVRENSYNIRSTNQNQEIEQAITTGTGHHPIHVHIKNKQKRVLDS